VLGYLLAEAIEVRFGAVRVKWPNDILMDNYKIGGILVEERGGHVLAGIGLNLVWAPGADELRDGHSVTAGMIPASSEGLGPLGLWLFLVNQLETGYRTLLDSHTVAEFLTLFRSRLAWTGRRVFVQEGPRSQYQATILGVSGKGELVLSRDGEEVVLVSGDVTPL
jgi:BirA family biotin operon repressor/biotin-[acetyl-CoA-carboxylase] ligase